MRASSGRKDPARPRPASSASAPLGGGRSPLPGAPSAISYVFSVNTKRSSLSRPSSAPDLPGWLEIHRSTLEARAEAVALRRELETAIAALERVLGTELPRVALAAEESP